MDSVGDPVHVDDTSACLACGGSGCSRCRASQSGLRAHDDEPSQCNVPKAADAKVAGHLETSSIRPNCWERCLFGGCFGCCGPCLPCWFFFLIGWGFTGAFVWKLRQEGADIFSFDEPAVQSDLKVQRYYALQAALGEREGCGDKYHQTEVSCNSDEKCEWYVGGMIEECREKATCRKPTPRPREQSLYLDWMPAWVGIVYDAGKDGDIFDDDVLGYIDKYEQELFTSVNGATNSKSQLSPWDKDWCSMVYLPSGDAGKCAPGATLLNLFSMNKPGRLITEEQVKLGYTMLPGVMGNALSCMCTHEDKLCDVCTADGNVTDTLPTAFLSCVEAAVLKEMTAMLAVSSTSSTTTTTSTTNMLPMCPSLDTGMIDAQSMMSSFAGMVDPATLSALMVSSLMPVVKGMLQQTCAAKPSCQWSPPYTHQYCSSTAFYRATDGDGLVTGAEKAAAIAKMCDPLQTMWWNSRKRVLPLSFDCSKKRSRYARSFFFAGAPSQDPDEGEKFTKGYVEARGGWYQNARIIEDRIEKEANGKLRIMQFSGATVIAQYLEILMIDGLLSLGSLVLVWLYMWFTLESVFLASCGMFEIVFSLPVAMSLWTILLDRKIFYFQMLVIYMILGIGADDVFILYDAWLQSAYQKELGGDRGKRFAWAYRRSFHAMLVTTATTCGSFAIGAVSPLPQVQAFCVFAAVVVFVDWLFCVTFFASAVMVYERFMKGMALWCTCCTLFGVPLRHAGVCFGPGFCWGGWRAIFSCCGACWKCLPKPKGSDEEPEMRAMEKFFSGPVFKFYRCCAIPLVILWFGAVGAAGAAAGLLLRTATKRAPLGRENIDVIRAWEILLDEFEFRGTPKTMFAYGLDDDKPMKEWGSSAAEHTSRYGGTSAKGLKEPAKQLELLQLCRAPELGEDDDKTRCDDKSCLIKGSPLPGSCEMDVISWRLKGIYIPSDVMCQSSRYCWMEDFTYFWASRKGNCKSYKDMASCVATAGCSWDVACYSTTDPLSYPGLEAPEFIEMLNTKCQAMDVLNPLTNRYECQSMPVLGGFTCEECTNTSTVFEDYLLSKVNYLKSIERQYEADFYVQHTGLRMTEDRKDIFFAWHSYNATYPRENTVEQANDWFDRWESFRKKYGGNLGGFQTTELYLYMVTQNEMVKAAAMGIGLSLAVSYVVLMLTTLNWWSSSIGMISIISITAAFLGVVSLIGWSLGENECIFMIATVGLSVDYTVHLLNAYNSVKLPTRQERVQGALAEMGISVANSAITTLLAAAILFACGFFFFFQFGGFIFIVIGLSIVMSTNLLMPLLILFGPQRDQGKCPCVRRRYKQGVEPKTAWSDESVAASQLSPKTLPDETHQDNPFLEENASFADDDAASSCPPSLSPRISPSLAAQSVALQRVHPEPIDTPHSVVQGLPTTSPDHPELPTLDLSATGPTPRAKICVAHVQSTGSASRIKVRSLSGGHGPSKKDLPRTKAVVLEPP